MGNKIRHTRFEEKQINSKSLIYENMTMQTKYDGTLYAVKVARTV